jgi:hypothetical protein
VTRTRRSTATLLALIALALGALAMAGCGDDDDGQVTLPTISVEQPTTTGETTTAPSTTGTGDSGGVAPNADPSRQDSQSNDTPPEPGSPEEAFENACKQNPAACG